MEIDSMKVQAENARKLAELDERQRKDIIDAQIKERELAFNEWKTRLENETKLLIAELQANKDIKTTAMNINGSNPESFLVADLEGNQQPNPALAGLIEAINQNMERLVAQQTASHQQMMETLTRPKQVIRGKDGRVVGVQ
jgi:hypothetical protein